MGVIGVFSFSGVFVSDKIFRGGNSRCEVSLFSFLQGLINTSFQIEVCKIYRATDQSFFTLLRELYYADEKYKV